VSGDDGQRKPSRAGGWVVNVLLAAAVGLCALIIIPALLGFHRYVIDGSSMEPAIPYGSMAYAREVPVEELVVGDVITFQPPPEYPVEKPVTHRIVEIEETPDGRTFRTQGDNNATPDPWTMTLDGPTQARVAFHLAYVGYIYIALSIWWVRFLLITVPAVALAVWIVAVLWREAGREVDEEKARLAAGGTSGP
jgi:signal peptidase